jgi:hypothetical protein
VEEFLTDAARDKYLRKTHLISNAEFKSLSPDNTCAICGGKPLPGKNLHCDHDHAINKIKIKTWKEPSGWWAEAWYLDDYFRAQRKNKSSAIKEVRKLLRRRSVRGALCGQCNRSLGKARFGHKVDSAELLARASLYLMQHKSEAKIG